MENKLKIVYVPIEDLKPSEYNPRIMTEGEANRLKDSLDEFGMVEPIVVNGAKERMNIIIGGHQRYNLCKMQGLKEMPVVYMNIPDIEKEQELNLRLNKNMGSWDWDMLANMDVDLLEEVGFEKGNLLEKFGLLEVELIEVPLDRLNVITVEMPEAVRLKERHAFYCDSVDEYKKICDYFQFKGVILSKSRLLQLINERV